MSDSEGRVPRMRAAVIDRHGGPEVIDVRRVPVPRLAPDEVLVRVAAAACNNTDIWTREGAYGDADSPGGWLGPLDFPRVQGADVCGEVVELGTSVQDPSLLGARVLLDPAGYDGPGPDAAVADVLGSERDGGFAELVAVPADRAHRVDDSPLSDVELAALPIAYGTAMGMLERGDVQAGHDVLVTGASGGVGLAAVQLATARGARVVAVCSGDKSAGVLAAGADVVVERGDDMLAAAADAAPRGYDVVVDLVAGGVVGEALGLLRRRGRWVVSGALAGHDITVDVRRLYLSDLAIVGSTMHTRRVFDRLVELAVRGEVRPAIAATFSLDDLAEAQRALASRRHVGKIVVVP